MINNPRVWHLPEIQMILNRTDRADYLKSQKIRSLCAGKGINSIPSYKSIGVFINGDYVNPHQLSQYLIKKNLAN